MEDSESTSFRIRFWGVRGSIPCPGGSYARYGGNTSCVEVRCGAHRVILDGGSGMRELGANFGKGQDCDVLLTHTHIDHILGMPFFTPFFDRSNRFVVWAGHLDEPESLQSALAEFMVAPLFPVPPSVFTARMEYRDFEAGDTLVLRERLLVRTAPLRHPNGATGYRLEFGGRSVCYVTDTEHVPGQLDPQVVDLIRGADLVIYDCSFTDEEFPRHVGWGHSTWQEGVRLCEAAGARRLVIFHHDPSRHDEAMDQLAAQVDLVRPGTVVAREGMVLAL